MIGISPISQLPQSPPYIRFERKPIERRKTVEEGGSSFYVDVDFAFVTSPGSKDTVEKVVAEWFPRLKEEIRQGRFPAQWLEAYEAAYRAWKNDQEPPINGTDLRQWPVASPAEIKMLRDLRVMSVEELATGNEELIMRIGMGARALKQKAVDWLAAKTDHGPLVERLSAQEATIKGLEARLEGLTARLAIAEAAAASRPAQEYAPPQPLGDPADRLSLPKDNTDELIGSSVDEELQE